jgi:dolichol-phosphate mannosyltransferase
MKIVVVIPTYNERDNIKILINALLQKFALFPKYDFNILVVDGNSKDGTAEAVKDLQKESKLIYLLEETSKSGLGSAYIKGFEYSISKLNSDYVVEMDADLQHSPEDFVNLISEIEKGYDVIIGSRYVKGGSVPNEWALYRKLISYFGSLFARTALRIPIVKDFTSGFKVTKVKGVLDQVDFSKIKSKGFAYKMDFIIIFSDMKVKFKEVPIHFGLRDRGTSKMEKTNFKDSFNLVITYFKERNKNFLKFVMVGFGGLFTDLLVFNISNIFVRSATASIISGSVAMLFTFTLNNFWSFRDRKAISFRMLFPTFLFYVASSYVPILLRSYLIHQLEVVYGESFLISNLGMMLGISFGIIWNFTVYSKIIWKKKNA